MKICSTGRWPRPIAKRLACLRGRSTAGSWFDAVSSECWKNFGFTKVGRAQIPKGRPLGDHHTFIATGSRLQLSSLFENLDGCYLYFPVPVGVCHLDLLSDPKVFCFDTFWQSVGLAVAKGDRIILSAYALDRSGRSCCEHRGAKYDRSYCHDRQSPHLFLLQPGCK